MRESISNWEKECDVGKSVIKDVENGFIGVDDEI